MNLSKKSAVIVAAVAAIGAISLTSASANAAGLELVIKNTDAVPGIADVQWAAGTPFQTPSIDLFGNVGFRGILLTGGAVTTSNNQTMHYGAPGGLNYVARTGDQAPGLPSGVLATAFNSQNLPLSPNGHTWFGSGTSAPNGYIATGTPLSLTSVVRNGDTLPGGPGPVTGNPASGAYSNVNNLGHTIVGASMGANFGVWVGNGANLQKAYQLGQPFAGLPAGDVNSPFGNIINGSGALLANVGMQKVAPITDNDNQVLAVLPFGGATATAIARESDPAPGAGGATYLKQLQSPPLNLESPAFNFTNGNFNNLGHAVYSAGLEGTGVTAANNAAIFTYDGTSAQLFRRRGDAVSGVSGATYSLDNTAAFQARLNNNDTIAWWSRLTQGVGGVTAADDTVLSRTSLGSATDTVLAREGSASVVPGALWGINFSDLMQNNADQIVFTSILLDDPNDPNNNVTTANDQALFAWDPAMGLSLIAREGDDLSSIGINMTVTAINLFNAANAEGGANALADNGWLTFRVTGTGADTSAIIRTQVPEPSSAIALLATGGLMALRRRRVSH